MYLTITTSSARTYSRAWHVGASTVHLLDSRWSIGASGSLETSCVGPLLRPHLSFSRENIHERRVFSRWLLCSLPQAAYILPKKQNCFATCTVVPLCIFSLPDGCKKACIVLSRLVVVRCLDLGRSGAAMAVSSAFESIITTKPSSEL